MVIGRVRCQAREMKTAPINGGGYQILVQGVVARVIHQIFVTSATRHITHAMPQASDLVPSND